MIAEVENKRAKKDWAQFIRDLVDVHCPTAEKVVLVMDNLNTHKLSSLYEAFDPEEAHRLRDKLELHSGDSDAAACPVKRNLFP